MRIKRREEALPLAYYQNDIWHSFLINQLSMVFILLSDFCLIEAFKHCPIIVYSLQGLLIAPHCHLQFMLYATRIDKLMFN